MEKYWVSLTFLFYQHCEKTSSCKNTNVKAITSVFCTNKIILTMIDSAVHGALDEVKSNRWKKKKTLGVGECILFLSINWSSYVHSWHMSFFIEMELYFCLYYTTVSHTLHYSTDEEYAI